MDSRFRGNDTSDSIIWGNACGRQERGTARIQPRVYYAKACGITVFGDSRYGVTKKYPMPRFVAM